MTKASGKIIVALDVATKNEALVLVEQLSPEIRFFKVGLQLFTSAGPEFVRELVRSGAKIFLDLKLHDIPNTVSAAVDAAAELGAEMLTVHLSGGETMVRAAVEAGKNRVGIIGVTALTSHNQETLRSIGIGDTTENYVLRLTRLGIACRIRGVVASAREAKRLREEFGETIKIITPGIRPTWSETGDQKRITTPKEALASGADYLVIGRPITAHSSPLKAVRLILSELQS
ncbi:MAG: orotidine-5-phosphate decarboxylase [Verrucomicrobiota bacterium]|jgi:orotidine-5'-phosphate decarboxylase